MLGMHERATDDTRWNRPFDMIRDGEHTFTWTYSGIAEHLATQWRTKPDGCHCENTKVWPLCLSAAGLGLQLHDVLHGTTHAEVADRWWHEKAKPDYFDWAEDGPADLATFYFDPEIDYHHKIPLAMAGPLVAYYQAGQHPEDARTLFEASLAQLGLDPTAGPVGPLDPRPTAMLWLLAEEWGMAELAAGFRQSADEHLEPTWDRSRGELTWGLQLDEEHPRGQWNAALAAAEATTPGAWARLATTTGGTRFEEPTVVGVDFPRLALRRARWDAERRELHLGTAISSADLTRQPTTFRITNVGDPSGWTVVSRSAGDLPVEIRVVDGELEVTTVLAETDLVLGPT
jgi:hypothetical protein